MRRKQVTQTVRPHAPYRAEACSAVVCEGFRSMTKAFCIASTLSLALLKSHMGQQSDISCHSSEDTMTSTGCSCFKHGPAINTAS